jgi:hypothetical protein
MDSCQGFSLGHFLGHWSNLKILKMTLALYTFRTSKYGMADEKYFFKDSQWSSLHTLVSLTSKTNCHDQTEKLLKAVLEMKI